MLCCIHKHAITCLTILLHSMYIVQMLICLIGKSLNYLIINVQHAKRMFLPLIFITFINYPGLIFAALAVLLIHFITRLCLLYFGGCSLMWRVYFSNVENFQYCWGTSSVMWKIFSACLYYFWYSFAALLCFLLITERYPPTLLCILHITKRYLSTLLQNLHITEDVPPYYWWYLSTILNSTLPHY